MRVRSATWTLSAAFCSLLLILPLILIFTQLLQPANDWPHIVESLLGNYIGNTCVLVISVNLIALLFAAPTAWLTVFYDFWGAKIWAWALILPITIPSYIAGFCYFDILDQAIPFYVYLRNHFGFEIAQLAERGIRWGLLVVLLAAVLYPYLFFYLRANFLSQKAVYYEVAYLAGKGRWYAFFKIGLPLARPALFAALSLLTMEVVNDYGAIHFFGIPTLTEGIFHAWFALEDSVSALRISLLLMLLILPFFAIESYFRRRKRYSSGELAQQRVPQKRLSPASALMANLACAIPLILGFIYPLYKLTHWAFGAWNQFDTGSFLQQTISSLGLALVATFGLCALALFLAYVSFIRPHRLIQISIRAATMGYFIPGAVIAVGVMLLFAFIDQQVSFWTLSASLGALAFAYCVRFVTIGYQPLRANFSGSCRILHEASRLMGKSEFKTLLLVHAPAMKPTLLAAIVLVFIDITKELPLTLIIRPSGFETLATSAFGYAKEGQLSYCAIPCLSIICLGVVGLALANYLTKDSKAHAKD
ncbi:MAG: ABC transporter permease [Opitutales bacterium]